MRSRLIVVGHIFVDELVQVPVIDDQHVSQTLAPHTADQFALDPFDLGR